MDGMPPYVTPHPQGTLLRLKVVPNASRERIMGPLGDALKLAVTVPAESGKANSAVIKLLSEKLDLPQFAIELIRGHTQPRKDLIIHKMSPDEVAQKLSQT
jgi:uncharacterized protein (TIGR00251 family)